MNTNLKTQIREYAAGVESEQAPITVEEVRLRLDRQNETEPVLGLRPSVESPLPMRRPWPALVAAMVVLAIFGVFVFVFPGDEAPPADTIPDPVDRETGYYVPTDVPEGFVLQDMEASQVSSSLFYVRESPGEWQPEEGGFRIFAPLISFTGLSEDPEEYLSDIVESNVDAGRVEIADRPAVIREVEYVDGPVNTTLVSLVAVDEQGSVFEITASGMTTEDVLSIARGVERVSVAEFVVLGSNLEWELRMTDRHDRFEYVTRDEIETVARNVDIVLGLDVLIRSNLAFSGRNEAPVITTDDGSIVEPEEGTPSSSSASLYLDVSDGEVDQALESLSEERVMVSPRVADGLTNRYVDAIRDGVVLSEDPYVIQAPRGPEPQFDTAALGEELSLDPAESADVLPEALFIGPGPVPLATEGRPVIVIGTARQPESEWEGVTGLLWFTDLPGLIVGATTGSGIGSSGESYPLATFGIGGEGRTEREGVMVAGRMSYTVPFETAVVQIVTEDGTFRQSPIAGYGVISYGDTVDRPTSIIAYDAEGDQLGEWEAPRGEIGQVAAHILLNGIVALGSPALAGLMTDNPAGASFRYRQGQLHQRVQCCLAVENTSTWGLTSVGGVTYDRTYVRSHCFCGRALAGGGA